MTDQTPALDAALMAFQGEFLVVPLDGANEHFGSRYATLPTIVQRMTPVLRSHGLMFKSWTEVLDGATHLVMLLLHVETQESMVSRMRLPDGNPQGIGSALTYFRRYTMLTMTGVVADGDDDGNAASAPPVRAARAGRPQVQMMSREQFDALRQWASQVNLEQIFDEILKRPATSDDMTFDEAARVLQHLHGTEDKGK
jgi:hypothetical protein